MGRSVLGVSGGRAGRAGFGGMGEGDITLLSMASGVTPSPLLSPDEAVELIEKGDRRACMLS